MQAAADDDDDGDTNYDGFIPFPCACSPVECTQLGFREPGSTFFKFN